MDDSARMHARVERATRLSRVRGLMLGLALGDAFAVPHTADGPLRSTVTTQLACFTAEGLIRAWNRANHKGITSVPGIVWNAHRRWAALQQLDGGQDVREIDGWLRSVPVLAERRGNAPAILAALRDGVGTAPPTSRGHHAVTRLLPVAAVPGLDSETVRELAGAAHGSKTALESAVVAIGLARAALTVSSVAEAADAIGASVLLRSTEGVPLADLGRSHSARSALRGGIALAAGCPDSSHVAVAETLRRIDDARVPAAVGPVAGALIGAVHGVEALPVALVSRLELGGVVDTLARDLVAQELDNPGGDGYSAAPDPHWDERYPGW